MTGIETLTERAFAPDGPLAARGYAHNAAQARYAAAVARGMADGSAVNAVEGETGTGKSLGYAVPLCLAVALGGDDARGMVSTFTRGLQRQLVERDLVVARDVVEDLTGTRLYVAPRLGQANFADPDRADSRADAYRKAGDAEAAAMLEALAAWARRDDTSGLTADWLEDGHALPDGLTADDVGQTAGGPRTTAYERHLQEARQADVLVVNHALLVLHLRFGILGQRPDVLVVDEADRLETAAGGLFDTSIALRRAHRVLTAAGLDTAAVDHLDTVAERLADRGTVGAGRQHVLLAPDMPQRDLAEIGGGMASLRATIAEAPAPDDPAMAKDLAVLRAQAASLERTAWRNDPRAEVAALRWSPARQYPAIQARQAEPGRIGGLVAYGDPPAAGHTLFTSAVLDAPGTGASFASLLHTLGIHDRSLVSPAATRVAPERFGHMALVLADPAAPRPTARDADGTAATTAEWLDYAAAGVRAARAEADGPGAGRTLVLTQSYADATALGARLEGLDGLMVQDRGGLDSLSAGAAAFGDTPGAVWLTPVGWEGLDLPHLVDTLVVTRLPFPAPDPVRQAVIRVVLENRGLTEAAIRRTIQGDAWNRARRLLRQGIGRGIRAADDRATVWLLDPRFPGPESWSRAAGLAAADGRFTAFRPCIPERFRAGPFSAYETARLFPADGSAPFSPDTAAQNAAI